MKKGIVLGISILQILNAGCASIVHGGKQTVHIETSPPGATLTVTGKNQEMITPADLVLKRNNDYELTIAKQGYKPEYVVLDRKISGWWLWGNIFSWGGLGMLVDMANGSSHKIEPKEIQVTLKPEGREI